ncbi:MULTISPECIES: NAD(P)-dependent oxidoreductase [unclassified Clostridium]|uniref:NAD(P)-dependent oxidoreductase n=1 Tax=unclassified Clostridium TaxID=2614128 RepID=UPI001898B229|nr:MULTISPECIES: NAD(P)-dependent oxidoreductase [unclassified Clostridium]MBP3915004.1 NAD(P)-dependent oxidoreductase [Clostridium sp.]
MPEYSKANLHGELSYAPITLFGEKLKIGVIGAGRGALIKVRNFYNKGSKIEVLALDFLEDFYKFNGDKVKLIKGNYNKDFILDKHLIIIAIDNDSVINEIKDDCEKLCKIYINSSKFKDGMGVIPVTRESKFITVAVNTKVGNPRGSVMVAESITESLEEFDEYIRLTGEIRNSLFLDKEIKDDLLKFINSSDCKFFYNKDKIFEVFKLFYNEDIVSKIKSLRKEE